MTLEQVDQAAKEKDIKNLCSELEQARKARRAKADKLGIGLASRFITGNNL